MIMASKIYTTHRMEMQIKLILELSDLSYTAMNISKGNSWQCLYYARRVT